jgi:RimJ/RimL family protein N-acetyltransferase
MTIRIEPLKLAWIEALTAGDDAFIERFGIAVAPGWAGFPEALPFALDAARKANEDPWGPYVFFDENVLVGFGGFKGPARAGVIEIGYAVAPSRQGRGVATAATRLLVDRARDGGVRTVVAHTLAEANSSTSVLERCGFTRVATTPDPDGQLDVDVWRWETALS